MSQATLRIQKISGHAGSVPGEDTQREFTVCKLIDTTTCIGCKACEVACMEWNDLPFGETVFDNTYQTMPETRWNYWNLIRFNEHEREDGTLMWLMRKNQCMHCADPGCLKACPSDGAIVQYTNGIVDFQQDNCIGCGYCITGCPFNIPKFNPETKHVYKCTLCADRVSEGLEPACIKSCPTGCLHFGSKDDMKELADSSRQAASRSLQLPPTPASTIRRASAAPASCTFCTTPRSPNSTAASRKIRSIPWTVKLWKGPLKWLGNAAMIGGLIGLVVHYLRFGPKTREEDLECPARRSATVTTSHPPGHVPARSARSHPALHLSRAPGSLARRALLHLSACSPVSRSGPPGFFGSPSFSAARRFHACCIPWIGLIFFVGIVQMFFAVGLPDGHHSGRSRVVRRHRPLYPQRRRRDAARRPLQRRTKTPLLGLHRFRHPATP